jgi:ribosomal protein S18 acetylase RimI-like enzyme
LQVLESKKTAVTLRQPLAEDEAFLYKLYATLRAEDLAPTGWNETQMELFLKMQLAARDQSYRMHYPQLDDRIIVCQDQKIGRLIVSRAAEEIRLVDIALLPEYRNAGIGTSLIKNLFREAEATDKTIRLQVEKTNPQARHLYERLGFVVSSENQTHFQMERPCDGSL